MYFGKPLVEQEWGLVGKPECWQDSEGPESGQRRSPAGVITRQWTRVLTIGDLVREVDPVWERLAAAKGRSRPLLDKQPVEARYMAGSSGTTDARGMTGARLQPRVVYRDQPRVRQMS